MKASEFVTESPRVASARPAKGRLLKLAGVLLSLALFLSFFALSPASASAASAAPARPASCNFHTVGTQYLYNANSVSMGTLYLLADGCGDVEIHLQTSQSMDMNVSLSDGGYYMLSSTNCYLTYDCWSSSLTYGTISVYATGTVSFQGIQYAYGETGYHNGYE